MHQSQQSLKQYSSENIKSSISDGLASINNNKFIDLEEPKDDPVKHIYLNRQVSSFNNKSQLNQKEDNLKMLELQEESLHYSIFNDKISFQHDKLKSCKYSGEGSPLNERNTTFKPKYFTNTTSDQPQTNNNIIIKFNEKNISELQVSSTDINKELLLLSCKESDTITNANTKTKTTSNCKDIQNTHDNKDLEFLNTLLRLKSKNSGYLITSLNDNFNSQSIRNTCNLDYNDLYKVSMPSIDLYRSSEIEGVSLNHNFSNTMNETKNSTNYFSMVRSFRINSPNITECSRSPYLHFSPENKESSIIQDTYKGNQSNPIGYFVEKTLTSDILNKNKVISTRKKDKTGKLISEDITNREIKSNPKLNLNKYDKNKRIYAVPIDESLKRLQVYNTNKQELVFLNANTTKGLKNVKKDSYKNLDSIGYVKTTESKTELKSSKDEIIDKLLKENKRTFSLKNIKEEKKELKRSNELTKVEINNACKRQHNPPKLNLKYFEDRVIDARVSKLSKSCKKIRELSTSERNIEMSRNSKENIIFPQKNLKCDMMSQKFDIQHCEIDLFCEDKELNKHKPLIDDKDGTNEIVKPSTKIADDKYLDLIDNHVEKSNRDSKLYYKNFIIENNVKEIKKFCSRNKAVEQMNRQKNNNYNINSLSSSKVSHIINLNENKLISQVNQLNYENESTNKGTSYNRFKTELSTILIEEKEICSELNDLPRNTLLTNEDGNSQSVFSAEIDLYEYNTLDTKNILETQKNFMSVENLSTTKHSINRNNLIKKHPFIPKNNKSSCIKITKNLKFPSYRTDYRKIKSPDLIVKYLSSEATGNRSDTKIRKIEDSKQNLNKSDNNQTNIMSDMIFDSVLSQGERIDNDKRIIKNIKVSKDKSNLAFSPKLNCSRGLVNKYNDKASYINNPHLLISKIENKLLKASMSKNQKKDLNLPKKSNILNILSSPIEEKFLNEVNETIKKKIKGDKMIKKTLQSPKKIISKRISLSVNEFTNYYHNKNILIEDKTGSSIRNFLILGRKSEINTILSKIDFSNEEKDKKIIVN